MGESAEQFLSRAVTTGGRVVSSNDLNEWQLSEARVLGNFWVSAEGFGWAILPWELTTDKDRDRERKFFGSRGGTDKTDGKNPATEAWLVARAELQKRMRDEMSQKKLIEQRNIWYLEHSGGDMTELDTMLQFIDGTLGADILKWDSIIMKIEKDCMSLDEGK